MMDLEKLEALAKAALGRGEEDCESLNDWFSAEEYMSNMLLHPVDARFAEACTPTAILALIAEVRALRERLEIDPRHPYDGIECRNETIALQDEQIAALREDLQAAKLLAHANAEMFKAEKADNAALRKRWDDQLVEALMNCAVPAAGAKMIFDEMEAIDAARGAK